MLLNDADFEHREVTLRLGDVHITIEFGSAELQHTIWGMFSIFAPTILKFYCIHIIHFTQILLNFKIDTLVF